MGISTTLLRATLPALIGLLAIACVPSLASRGTDSPQPVRLEQLQGDFVCNGGGVFFRLTIGPDSKYREVGIGRWKSPQEFIPSSACQTGSAALHAGKLVLSGGLPCDHDGVECLTTSEVILAIQRVDARGFSTPLLTCERK